MIVTPAEIKTYLSYNWWKILFSSIIILIIWTVLINEITTPRENQRIVISAINIDIEADQLELDGLQYMEKYDNQDIKAVFMETIDIDGPEFHEFVSTRSLPGTDLIILPRSSIQDNTASDLFLPLDEETVLDYFGDSISYFYEDSELYGISLMNSSYETVFSSYILSDTSEEYYVFINAYSRNIGEWNEDSLATEQAALEFIIWLISEIE